MGERILVDGPDSVFDDELRSAFVHARTAANPTPESFREAARRAEKGSKQRVPSPIEAPMPGDGLPVSVKVAFATHTEPNDGYLIDIRWSLLPADQIYAIDLDDHRLVLNARYRSAIVGHPSLDIDDAPLVKSLLLLLLEDHFVGTGGGAKKKRENVAWQAILLAAVHEQHAQGKVTTHDE